MNYDGSRYIKKTPPARSLIYGLRNIGYDFSTAIADIIDNSISAQAKNIEVLSNPDAEEPYLVIFDDGCGMGLNDLNNAMTLGSDRENKEDSDTELGRFGLGLKSASFSQCLRLTVASKKTNKINAMRYDLEEMQKVNDWFVEKLSDEEIEKLPEISKLFEAKSGTIVIWEKFDKMAEEAASFKDSFNNAVGVAKKHIEFVFHRFYNDVNIEFNYHKIEKRDPFLSNYPATQKGRETNIAIDGYDKTIDVVPYALPYANSLSEEQKKLLGNPKSIYDEQGFYIYRNKRLIVWGSRLRMRVRSEFNKLARVQVDVPSEFDDIWTLDVKKSSVKIPDLIRDKLYSAIDDSIKRSNKEVRYRGKKELSAKVPVWSRIKMRGGEVKYEINRDSHPLYNQLVKTLNDEQLNLLNLYLDKVEEYIPNGMIVSDNADSIKIINSHEDSDEDKLMDEVVNVAKGAKNPEIIIDEILSSQGYEKIADKKAEILRRLQNEHEKTC